MNRDNKGFSLVELLVVIAVMAILAGVGLQGFGLVANGNMKKTAGLLNEELRTVQKNSKNIYADYYWQLVIENDDGRYKVEIIRMNKKTITNPDGSTTDILDPEVYDSQNGIAIYLRYIKDRYANQRREYVSCDLPQRLGSD